MNNCNFTGRLTKDPELKAKQDGTGSYLFFTIAVDAGKDKNGDKLTDFIDCYANGQSATFLSTYAHKGDLIEVIGRLHTSSREDENGQKTKRYTVMVNHTGILSKKEPTEAKPAEIKPAEPDGSELPFEL